MATRRRHRRAELALAAALLAACGTGDRGEREPTHPAPVVAAPTGEATPEELVRRVGEVGLSPGNRRRHSLPLNNPSMVRGPEASHMRPHDVVVGVVVEGQARAYPWWVMRQYHVVNETVPVDDPAALSEDWRRFVREPGGRHHVVRPYVPLLITLCEACSGAAAFVPVVGEGDPLVFSQCRGRGTDEAAFAAIGVYTICDLQTQSRWHPFSGRAGSGPLAGARLARRPVFLEHWDTWLRRYPGTLVVAAGEELRERPHAAHADEVGQPGAHTTYEDEVERTGREDRRLAPDAMVLGVGDLARSDAVAVSLEALRDGGGVLPVRVGDRAYVLVASGGYRAMVYRAELGGEPLALEREPGETFLLRDASGSLWNDLGEAVAGPHRGRHLEPAEDAYLVEWSDWIMEHPHTRVLAAPGAGGPAG